MRNDFEQELRGRLASYIREPNEALWEGITRQINQPKPDNINEISRGMDVITWGSLFIIMILLIDGQYMKPVPVIRHERAAIEQSANNPRIDETQSTEQNKSTQPGNGSKRSTISVRPKPETRNKESRIRTDQISRVSIDAVRNHAEQGIAIGNVTGSTSSYYAHDSVSRIEASMPPSSEELKSAGLEKEMLKKEMKKAVAIQREVIRKQSEKNHQKFKLYFTAMPTFGYQRIESNQNDNIIIESISKISAFSADRIGLRVELGASVPIAKRLEVFGGVLYYQRKQTIGYTETQVDSTYVSQGPGGEVIVNPAFTSVDKSFEYELKNLGLQVGLNYVLKKDRFLQLLGTGLEFQFALNKLRPEDAQIFTNNPSAYVFCNFYYRLQYPSEGRLKAVFQPTLNYSFYINQNLNAPFYVKPYGLGLNIGLTYNF